MKDEMMAKIMDEVMKKMGGTEAPAQSMAFAKLLRESMKTFAV